MLTRLHVRGYKALRDIETALEPLTVIVGPNGCGKTSVLEAIAMVRDFVVDGEGARKLHAFEELRWKGATPSSEIAVEAWAPLDRPDRGGLGDAADEVEGEHESKLVLTVEEGKATLSVQRDPPLAQERNAPRMRTAHRKPDQAPMRAWSTLAVRRLELDSRALSKASYAREIVPRLGDDGDGLATVLSAMLGEQPEQFEAIQAQLREFVPELERIRIRPAPLSIVETQEVPVALDADGKEVLAKKRYQRDVVGHEVVLDYRYAKGVPARHASEGTLLLLGLLTVVHMGDVSVLLLDDIDRGLHPKAQQQLVAYLRSISERRTQIIATTHSPDLVLHVEYEEVRAMLMSETDGALMGKLTENPEYERWHENMSTSEFWTVFGEEWLAKAKRHG